MAKPHLPRAENAGWGVDLTQYIPRSTRTQETFPSHPTSAFGIPYSPSDFKVIVALELGAMKKGLEAFRELLLGEVERYVLDEDVHCDNYRVHW